MSKDEPILLFDMDGVLLEPRAYHRALRENVAFWGSQLGYSGVELTQAEVHAFESAGITAEWVSGSFCVALLLVGVWELVPDAELPAQLLLPPLPNHSLTAPDFSSAIHAMGQIPGAHTQQERCLVFLENAFGRQPGFERLKTLIEGARAIHTSAIHRLQQELILGSATLESVYGLDAWWDHPGYLREIDIPHLKPEARDALVGKNGRGDFAISVLTNRPSTPPDGYFDTPEAEIGLSLLGIEDIPAVGAGVMGWLAEQHGHPTNHYLKPSPVHALTALLVAIGIPLEAAAVQSSALVEGSPDLSVWLELDRRHAYVFEDASHGLQSLIRAVRLLGAYDIFMEMTLVGIAEDRHKVESLQDLGAKVYARLDHALKDLALL
jgi:hypothetical protein